MKAEAIKAGLNLVTDDQESGFVDDEGDGKYSCSEEVRVGSVPLPRIQSWLHKVVDGAAEADNVEEPEVDAWERASAGPSGSKSVVAEGAERKRIDQWNKIMGR